jgi:hypothetical protein
MAQIVPYLVGGVTALLVMNLVPSAAQQIEALRTVMSHDASSVPTAVSVPAVVNRAAKGDRLPVSRTVQSAPTGVVKPVPMDADQAKDRRLPSRARKPPLGCEPSFSPVAAPSLAHHTGRCVARLEGLVVTGMNG